MLRTERMTHYQLIKRRRRRAQRAITSVYDPDSGRTETTTRGVVNAFCTFLQRKYSPLPVNEERIRHMTEAGFARLPEWWKDTLDVPLTADELRAAIFKGDAKKAPGRDGIGLSLFQATWNALQDDWFELFVCIPKTTKPNKPSDYRPITLLNTNYKILAHIVANRIRHTLEELLHPSQYCGRPGNTIFEAIASVREAIAFAEVNRKPLCILTLDFKDAFDRISHTYFFVILRSYGFSDSFVDLIRPNTRMRRRWSR